jgi:hypothetical protein
VQPRQILHASQPAPLAPDAASSAGLQDAVISDSADRVAQNSQLCAAPHAKNQTPAGIQIEPYAR